MIDNKTVFGGSHEVGHVYGSAEIFNSPHKMNHLKRKVRNSFEYHMLANDIQSC